jgi:hypothetical protein
VAAHAEYEPRSRISRAKMPLRDWKSRHAWPGCSVTQRIQTSVFARLAPEGTAAKLAVVLKAGYSFSLKTIRRGGLRIDWDFMRKENEGRPGPVLVGTGRANSTRGGSLRLTLALTAAGRRLLARETQVSLTATGRFTGKRGKRVTATRPFTLSR